MKIVLNFCLFLLFSNLYGNAPYFVDRLYYNQDTIAINRLPLSPELEKLILSEVANFKDCQHMKCMEGFRIWELRNDSLFLKNIQNCCRKDLVNKKSQTILQQKYHSDEVFAGWINEKIYNQYGRQMYTVSDRRIFEFDRDFDIKDGRLQQIINYDNRNSSESIYRKNPEELLKFWLETIDWKKVEQYNKEVKKVILLSFEVDDDGRPCNIEVLRGVNEKCDSEIIKAVKKLPEFHKYYIRGQLHKVKWNLPVKLDKNWYEERLKNGKE